MTRNKVKIFNIAAIALAACAAVLMFSPEAFAATAPIKVQAGDFGALKDLVATASISLAALRSQHADLVSRAAAKIAELKDDTPPEQARKIEDEHKELLRQIEAIKDDIAKAEADERRLALEVGTAPAPQVDDAAVRSAVGTAVADALATERQRTAEITSIGRRAGMDAGVIEKAIRDNTSVAEFRQLAFDKLTSDADKVRVSATHTRVEMGGQDADETRRNAAINALLHRADPGSVKLEDAAREFRGLSLSEMAKDFLEARGVKTRGLTKSQVAERAFHSTSDFPYILENVANRSLRAAYEAYPRTFQPFCRQITASDFKAMNRVQMGEAPQLLKVNENGEFKRGTITEGKQSIKIETYGRVVGITRQVIVNDDLGAFTRIPAMFGTSIATLESDIVWALIINNVVMADGTALFHANHKNLATGVAFSIDGISKTRLLLSKQVGLDGKTKINVRPRFLLLPSELETAAEQLLATPFMAEQSDKTVPASMRSLTPIVEPRLSDASDKAYYLAADPSTVDTLEYAYLEGNEGAYIETRQGFDVDGMEVKCRLDFGAAAIDWKGLAKNPGA